MAIIYSQNCAMCITPYPSHGVAENFHVHVSKSLNDRPARPGDGTTTIVARGRECQAGMFGMDAGTVSPEQVATDRVTLISQLSSVLAMIYLAREESSWRDLIVNFLRIFVSRARYS